MSWFRIFESNTLHLNALWAQAIRMIANFKIMWLIYALFFYLLPRTLQESTVSCVDVLYKFQHFVQTAVSTPSISFSCVLCTEIYFSHFNLVVIPLCVYWASVYLYWVWRVITYIQLIFHSHTKLRLKLKKKKHKNN